MTGNLRKVFISTSSAARRWMSNNIVHDNVAKVSDTGKVIITRSVHADGFVRYRLRPSHSAIASINKCEFVDIAPLQSTLTKGRVFAMIEGPGGLREMLESPVTGEVSDINDLITKTPEVITGMRDDDWFVEVDPSIESGQEESDFSSYENVDEL
jgi:glycine cleavage system H lipoate-binding protein